MVLRPIRPLFPLARILTKGEAIAMSTISNTVNARADWQPEEVYMIQQEEVKDLFIYKNGSLYWRNDTGTATKAGAKAGHIQKTGYVNVTVKRKKYQAHRLIYLYHFGYVPNQIDHINRVKDDNRIENLRPTDSSKNQMNTNNRRSSGRGVYERPNGRWRAQIYKNGKAVSLGHYSTMTEAQEAYDKAKMEIYGDL